jgi:hypothetical protein
MLDLSVDLSDLKDNVAKELERQGRPVPDLQDLDLKGMRATLALDVKVILPPPCIFH